MIEIPVAYLLAKTTGLKQEGVYYSIVIAETAMTILGITWFKLGRWKVKKV
jgi:Na+-driven multidrug efflux pump